MKKKSYVFRKAVISVGVVDLDVDVEVANSCISTISDGFNFFFPPLGDSGARV